MNALKVTQTIVVVAKTLLIAGLIFAGIVIYSVGDDQFVRVANPSFSIDSETLEEDLRLTFYEMLESPNADNKGIIFDFSTISISIPLNPAFRAMIAGNVLIVLVYLFVCLDIIQRVIKDIKNKNPFSIANTKRLQRLGLLIIVAPLFEWILGWVAVYYFSQHYEYEGLSLDFDAELGLPMLIVGFFIFTLGTAFKEGQKLREETELTI